MSAASHPRLVLASSSPRRRALMQEAGFEVEVWAPHVDESVPTGTFPAQAAVELAVRKAMAVEAPGAWILAADTLLDLDGEILGKPNDIASAVRTLRRLSGRSHWVVTGACVRRHSQVFTGLAQTKVTFRPLDDQEIARYVATGEPMDKAGAYAIQGGAQAFVERVDGAWDNVVGLPMEVVRSLLRQADYPLPS